jgi:hypothetical protein
VFTYFLASQQTAAETLELTGALLTRQQYAVTSEANRLTKGKSDRAHPPGLELVEQCLRTGALDLVFSAESDVSGDK